MSGAVPPCNVSTCVRGGGEMEELGMMGAQACFNQAAHVVPNQ